MGVVGMGHSKLTMGNYKIDQNKRNFVNAVLYMAYKSHWKNTMIIIAKKKIPQIVFWIPTFRISFLAAGFL